MTINIPDNCKVYRRSFKVSPVEFYRIQLEHICNGVNQTKLTILAYLYYYGYTKGVEKILEDRIVVSMSSLYNFTSTMRKEGLIVGYEDDIRLNEEIKLVDDPHVTLFFLDIDESKDEVNHKHFRK